MKYPNDFTLLYLSHIPKNKFNDKVQIKEVENEKYLGNRISAEGTNILDITTKCNRGTGIVNKIQTILETMYFGSF